jgi:hypothetical protein
MLKRAADWLRQHREARILIVGSCDSGGSDTCTHALAEGRGAAVRKFLEGSGIDSDQIVGVKAWDNLDQSCRTSDVECQSRESREKTVPAAFWPKTGRKCTLSGPKLAAEWRSSG